MVTDILQLDLFETIIFKKHFISKTHKLTQNLLSKMYIGKLYYILLYRTQNGIM